MDGDLIVGASIRVPRRELKFSFVRSSGPGGQNVNKVNTKAILRWAVESSSSLPEDVRARFLKKYGRRVSEDGQFILVSQRYRDQHQNVADCLAKLQAMLAAVAAPAKRRRPSRPSPAADARRLEEKRQRSEKKQRRRDRPGLES